MGLTGMHRFLSTQEYSMPFPRFRVLLLAALAISFVTSPARGQGMLERMKQKAQEKAQAKADHAADSLTDAALNNTERAVKCVISNLSCIQKAEEAGQPVTVVNAPRPIRQRRWRPQGPGGEHLEARRRRCRRVQARKAPRLP